MREPWLVQPLRAGMQATYYNAELDLQGPVMIDEVLDDVVAVRYLGCDRVFTVDPDTLFA